MSDTYHLHCETHDERVGSIQSYSELLAEIWEKREHFIAMYEAYERIGIDHDAIEVDWLFRNSDHQFSEDSLWELARWLKAHNDCDVYVYIYDRRVDYCPHYVRCPSCRHMERCALKRGHDGDHRRYGEE